MASLLVPWQWQCGGEVDAERGADGPPDSTTSTTGPTVDTTTVYCFAAGTRVAVEGGERPIEELSVGDRVLGYDHSLRRVVVQRVEHALRAPARPVIELSLSSGRHIEATAEHPFFARALGRYVPLGSLDAKTELLGLAAAQVTETASPIALASGLPKTVFNLTVSGTHNYFAEGVLVHNKSPDECPFNPARCPADCSANPASCQPSPGECVGQVTGYDSAASTWQACGTGEVTPQGLAISLPKATGAGGAGAGGGEGGARGDEGWVGDIVRFSTPLCGDPNAIPAELAIEVVALDTDVRGGIAVLPSQAGCNSAALPPSFVDVALSSGEGMRACIPVVGQAPFLDLVFVRTGGGETRAVVSYLGTGGC